MGGHGWWYFKNRTFKTTAWLGFLFIRYQSHTWRRCQDLVVKRSLPCVHQRNCIGHHRRTTSRGVCNRVPRTAGMGTPTATDQCGEQSPRANCMCLCFALWVCGWMCVWWFLVSCCASGASMFVCICVYWKPVCMFLLVCVDYNYAVRFWPIEMSHEA